MNQLRHIFIGVCLVLGTLRTVRPLAAQEQTGALIVDVKHYTSDVKIPKSIQKQLVHAGIPWGVRGNTLLIPLVNERFVNVDTLYLTRFGEQKKLEVRPGEYTITCIVFALTSASTNVDKSLSKNAFFNSDILKFAVLPDKTTTLEISPIFIAESTWFRLSRLKMYAPDLKVQALEDGQQKGEDVVITRRTDQSVAWDDYKGPLKF